MAWVGREGGIRKARGRTSYRKRPSQYDVVTCMEMLEHVPDPASIVRACSTLR